MLDEEASIGAVVGGIDRRLVDRVLVVDNGSRDRTARRARAAGAEVISEPRRGYGSACLTGIASASDADLLVYLDGDGSDDPSEIAALVRPLIDDGVDLVIGSRQLGRQSAGALTLTQRWGNRLACGLIHRLWGVRYTDLGPYRAIRREAQTALRQSDPAFGWTVEMQIRAAQRRLAICEVPVRALPRRGGRSKISGTIGGVLRAGHGILGTILRAKLAELRPSV